MSNALKLYLIILVSIVWSISLLAPIFRPEYQPAPETNVAFMAIIAVLTTTLEREAKSKDKTKSGTKEDETEAGDDT